jgi:hypothetical protein
MPSSVNNDHVLRVRNDNSLILVNTKKCEAYTCAKLVKSMLCSSPYAARKYPFPEPGASSKQAINIADVNKECIEHFKSQGCAMNNAYIECIVDCSSLSGDHQALLLYDLHNDVYVDVQSLKQHLTDKMLKKSRWDPMPGLIRSVGNRLIYPAPTDVKQPDVPVSITTNHAPYKNANYLKHYFDRSTGLSSADKINEQYTIQCKLCSDGEYYVLLRNKADFTVQCTKMVVYPSIKTRRLYAVLNIICHGTAMPFYVVRDLERLITSPGASFPCVGEDFLTRQENRHLVDIAAIRTHINANYYDGHLTQGKIQNLLDMFDKIKRTINTGAWNSRYRFIRVGCLDIEEPHELELCKSFSLEDLLPKPKCARPETHGSETGHCEGEESESSSDERMHAR